jgi:hypothetical protein
MERPWINFANLIEICQRDKKDLDWIGLSQSGKKKTNEIFQVNYFDIT